MRNFQIIAYSFILLLFLSSCGIPSFSIVDPPIPTNTTSTVLISFRAPDEDDDIFGYEVYYKIYKSDSDEILEDKDKIEDDNTTKFGDTLLKEIGGFNTLNIGELKQTTPSTRPLIKSGDLSGGEEFVINFSVGTGEVYLNGSRIGIPLRNVTDTEDGVNYYETFSDTVDNYDFDRNGVTEFDTSYTISFVAFSSVFDIIGTSEDSIPVFLGSISDRSNN